MKGPLSSENPWPGLDSFRSIDTEFFRGRDHDKDALFREVRRSRLVVLYGASGLGKTSLVHAGLSPLLAAEDQFLVPIRLAYKVESPTIARQILDELAEHRPKTASIAEPRPDETVWEYLHRRDVAIRGFEPILFFDQFEELFTLGAGAVRAMEAVEELKALIEGAPPLRIRQHLDAHPETARSFSFQQHPYRVLLGIRDDFLSKLESLRPEIPSIIHHRIGLLPLRGEAALEVVMQPPRSNPIPATTEVSGARPALVERAVAERIVRTVASASELDTAPLENLEIEPALLSLFCSELNRKRHTSTGGTFQITEDLVACSRTEIISSFYERALADVAPSVRAFIEDKLVTESGFRTSAVLKEALAIPGFAQEILDNLVNGRLLRVFERSHVSWVELTHDVLTRVVATSRAARRESERRAQKAAEEKRLHDQKAAEEKRLRVQAKAARRRRWAIGTIVLASAIVFLGHTAFLKWQGAVVARHAAREQALQMSLATRHYREALAQLALKVREDSGATIARLLLSDILRRQNWPLPTVPMFPEGPFTWIECALGASRCAAAYRDGRVLVEGDMSTELTTKQTGYAQLRFSRDGTQLLCIPEAKGTGIRWNLPSPEPFPFPMKTWEDFAVSDNPLSVVSSSGNEIVLHTFDTREPAPWLAKAAPSFVTIDHSGNRLAHRDSGTTVALIDVRTGKRQILSRQTQSNITQLLLSPDGAQLAVGTGDGKVAVWQMPDANVMGEIPLSQAVTNLVFQPDGRRLAVGSEAGALWLWSEPWTQPSVLADGGTGIMSLAFSPSSRWLVASRRDGSVGVWDTTSGSPIAAPIQHQALALATPIDEERLLTAALDGSSAVWSLPRRPVEKSIDLKRRVESAWFVSEDDIHADATGMAMDWTGETTKPTLTSTRTIFSRDRRFRASLYTNRVSLVETQTGTATNLASGGSTCSTFSRDGRRFLTLIDDKAQLWDTSTRKEIGSPLEGVTGAWLSHDGSFLATRSSKPGISIRSVSPDGVYSTGEILGGYAVCSLVAFDQKAERVLLVSENRAQVWNRKNRRFVGRPLLHSGQITYADFSANGTWLVTTSADKTARIWDAATGEPVSDRLPHEATVTSADFSPSGHRLLTATADGRLRLWDILMGLETTPRQNEQLARLAEIAAGLRIDAKTNELVPIDHPHQALSDLRTEIGDRHQCDSTDSGAQHGCAPVIDDLINAILAKR